MATKNNPGKYDCYAAAQPDEPLFILRANDELAPHIVRIWAMCRFGAPSEEIIDQVRLARIAAKKKPFNISKMEEAVYCAISMEEWKKTNGKK